MNCFSSVVLSPQTMFDDVYHSDNGTILVCLIYIYISYLERGDLLCKDIRETKKEPSRS